ncbi:MAG: hypothetical protein M3O50_11545 [Myxococcota bacterium]|nr:hypothetical protein [Myxococcota bacterium]
MGIVQSTLAGAPASPPKGEPVDAPDEAPEEPPEELPEPAPEEPDALPEEPPDAAPEAPPEDGMALPDDGMDASLIEPADVPPEEDPDAVPDPLPVLAPDDVPASTSLAGAVVLLQSRFSAATSAVAGRTHAPRKASYLAIGVLAPESKCPVVGVAGIGFATIEGLYRAKVRSASSKVLVRRARRRKRGCPFS